MRLLFSPSRRQIGCAGVFIAMQTCRFPSAVFLSFFVLFPDTSCGQFAAQPEAESGPLREVVVTASRFEEDIDQSASSISVVSAAEIERRGWHSVEEVLQNEAGVALVRSGGPGGSTAAFIRGANSEHTLVLIDGVEANNPVTTAGTFDFSGLTVDNIERIEILRGPHSTLYGSSALGGVINIITRKGQGAPSGTVSLEGGSYQSFTERAAFSGESGAVNYSLGASRRDSSGISAAGAGYGNSEQDGLGESAFSGRLGIRAGENLEGALIMRGQSSRADLDNSGGIGGDDPNRLLTRESLFARMQGTSTFDAGALRQDFGLSYTREDFDDNNDPDELHPLDKLRSSYSGDIVKLDFQNTWKPATWITWVAGLETKEEGADSSYRLESAFGPYNSEFDDRSIYNTGYFSEGRFTLADGLSTTLGLRLDHHSRTGDHLTWRIAPVYSLEETGTRVSASAGTAFKSPSLFQLYSPYGSEALNPEESLGVDAGVQQEFFNARMSIGATWFRNNFDELITFDPGTFVFSNISEARSSGLEFFTRCRVSEQVSLGVDLAYTETEDESSGLSLLRRPRVKIAGDLSYSPQERLTLTAGFVSVGKRYDNNFGVYPVERVELSAYTLFSLGASYRVADDIEMFVRLENALDSEYEDVYGYGTPGAAGYGGIRVRL